MKAWLRLVLARNQTKVSGHEALSSPSADAPTAPARLVNLAAVRLGDLLPDKEQWQR